MGHDDPNKAIEQPSSNVGLLADRQEKDFKIGLDLYNEKHPKGK